MCTFIMIIVSRDVGRQKINLENNKQTDGHESYTVETLPLKPHTHLLATTSILKVAAMWLFLDLHSCHVV